jgi:hypothetical protein
MPNYRVTFLGSEPLPKIGDYDEFLFRFSVVDFESINNNQENIESNLYSIQAKMSRSLQSIWVVDLSSCEKILYEESKKTLFTHIKSGNPGNKIFLDLNTSSASKTPPNDIKKIVMENGAEFKIETKKPLGFPGIE